MDKKQTSAINIKLLVIIYIILFFIQFSINYFLSNYSIAKSFCFSLATITISIAIIMSGAKFIRNKLPPK